MEPLTMKEALTKGMTRYFTGRECPAGHVAERIVSTRACSQCARDRKHAWNTNNPIKARTQKLRWRNRNLIKARKLNLDSQKLHRAAANIRQRRYASTHQKAIALKGATWEQANPERVATKAARYRAAKLRQMPGWANHEAIQMIYRAAEVFRTSGFAVHVDHDIPLQGRKVSGLHLHQNLRILSAKGNRIKSNLFQGA